MPGLGRIYAPDDRDKNFPMRAVLGDFRSKYFPRGLPPGTRHYRASPILHQGDTGTCVAHGWASWSQGAPLMIRPTPDMEPFSLYDRIIKQDEWHENDNDTARQFGTSVRAGAKVLQTEGRIANYYWAESAEDIRAWHLAGFGTVVLGILWYSSMWETDSRGFIRIGGRVEGGHAFKTTGWSDALNAVRCQQSWGPNWGQKGRFWIFRDDLDRLLSEDGEACAAIEQKLIT